MVIPNITHRRQSLIPSLPNAFCLTSSNLASAIRACIPDHLLTIHNYHIRQNVLYTNRSHFIIRLWGKALLLLVALIRLIPNGSNPRISNSMHIDIICSIEGTCSWYFLFDQLRSNYILFMYQSEDCSILSFSNVIVIET